VVYLVSQLEHVTNLKETLLPYGTYMDVTIMLAAASPLLHGVEKPVPVFVFFPMPPSHMCLPTSSPFCVPMFPSTAAYVSIDQKWKCSSERVMWKCKLMGDA
jgi:hypothetical protein